jgi:hypothetical protein
MNPITEVFGEPIHVYTRSQGLEDGTLVDVSHTAREAGFRLPVALTQHVHAELVSLTPAARRACNDEQGRLWDILWMASIACRSAEDADRVAFVVRVVRQRVRPTPVRLIAHIGPGDDGEPVITIMFPEDA